MGNGFSKCLIFQLIESICSIYLSGSGISVLPEAIFTFDPGSASSVETTQARLSQGRAKLGHIQSGESKRARRAHTDSNSATIHGDTHHLPVAVSSREQSCPFRYSIAVILVYRGFPLWK